MVASVCVNSLRVCTEIVEAAVIDRLSATLLDSAVRRGATAGEAPAPKEGAAAGDATWAAHTAAALMRSLSGVAIEALQ
jgi:hypothetical protein